VKRLWAIVTWLPRWIPKEKPWKWRPFFRRRSPVVNGMWYLGIMPYFWWQRGESGKDWDFNEFGLQFGFGPWMFLVGITDND